MDRHESEVFRALGYPNAQQSFGGDTVYVWGRSAAGTMFVPQTSTTTGYVGRTPIYGTTTTMQPVALNYNCTIRVIVGETRVAKSWEYDGNIGGCSEYIKRLRSFQKNG